MPFFFNFFKGCRCCVDQTIEPGAVPPNVKPTWKTDSWRLRRLDELFVRDDTLLLKFVIPHVEALERVGKAEFKMDTNYRLTESSRNLLEMMVLKESDLKISKSFNRVLLNLNETDFERVFTRWLHAKRAANIFLDKFKCGGHHLVCWIIPRKDEFGSVVEARGVVIHLTEREWILLDL